MKKQILVILISLSSVLIVNAQIWNGSSTIDGDIWRNGRLGIGVNQPENALHIKGGGITLDRLDTKINSINNELEIFNNTSGSLNLTVTNGVGNMNFTITNRLGHFNFTGANLYLDREYSKIQSIANEIEIFNNSTGNMSFVYNNGGDGQFRFIGADIYLNGGKTLKSDANYCEIFNTTTGDMNFIHNNGMGNINFIHSNGKGEFYFEGGDIYLHRDHTIIKSIANNIEIFNNATGNMNFVHDNGMGYFVFTGANVGIGTSTPEYPLDVVGTIRAWKVKINQLKTADFVFAPDYKLPSLNEVETYINTHKHLKDIPSADEMTKDGVEIGDLQGSLLQKIEELTLYTIEQNKKIEKLEKDKLTQEIKNAELQQQIKELKELIMKKLN